MSLMEQVWLDTMVTVVNCSTFLFHLKDVEGRMVNEEESPELYFRNEEEQLRRENHDYDEEEGYYWQPQNSNNHTQKRRSYFGSGSNFHLI